MAEEKKLVTENLDARFKELKGYWKNMTESSSLVDMSKSQLKKLASVNGARAGITRQTPSFYHPLFEKINLQLPTKTREVNQWCRHFAKTDGVIGNLLDLHGEFPLTGMHLTCDDPKIKKFYEILFFDVLRGEKLLLDINQEYWKLANAFPFGEWDDNKGIWTRFVLLNPDFVEVEKSMLVDEPILKLDPDDNLKRIVNSRQPREIYNALSKIQGGKIVNLIARGEKIPLNQFRVSHIAYKLSPYETVGTPIMFRAFKPLIYKDILRRAQIAIAERHITPIKVVKVGTDAIPATPEAIQAAKEAFDELSTDLSSWFFYHHAINFDYVSSAGKVLPLNTEYDWIDKEITSALLGFKAIISGDGPNFACYDEETETLTENGFKKWDEISEDEKIATFNPDTEELEYHYPVGRYVYDYDSEKDGQMVQFKTGKMDICVTPNHRMFLKERDKDEWIIKRADEVKNRSTFRSQIKWQGKIEYPQESLNQLFGKQVDIEDYLKLVAYYLSEGWVVYNKGSEYRVGIRQMETSKSYATMKETCQKFGFRIYKDSFILNGEKYEQHFEKEYGKGSANKSVPKWIKNLPIEYLTIFLEAIMKGDGSTRPNTKKKETENKYYQYTSISKTLANDVYEITYKVGNVPVMVREDFEGKNSQHHTRWSDSIYGKFPALESKNHNSKTNKSTNRQCIGRVDYRGKVYCFEVPNHLFITRRNGYITIQGNTASVSMRILINRYLRNQEILKDWVKNYVFRPVAIQQEFKRINEWGDEEYIIPEIEFEFMNLRDDQQQKQLLKELMKMGLVSKQTFFSYNGLNYEKEQKLVDKEREADKKKLTPPVKKTQERAGFDIPPADLGGGEMGGGAGMEPGLGGGMGETPPAMEEKPAGGPEIGMGAGAETA